MSELPPIDDEELAIMEKTDWSDIDIALDIEAEPLVRRLIAALRVARGENEILREKLQMAYDAADERDSLPRGTRMVNVGARQSSEGENDE